MACFQVVIQKKRHACIYATRDMNPNANSTCASEDMADRKKACTDELINTWIMNKCKVYVSQAPCIDRPIRCLIIATCKCQV